jgi:sugar lactone lactonase YvrE
MTSSMRNAMAPLRLAAALLAALCLAGGLALAAPARNILPLSQVKPGQKAVAKSVFHGTTIESFHLRIIGVMPKFDGSRSMILGKVLDGPVVERNSGIIQGMSGSPVYINGKLIGAISAGWSFSKEPIAGITPIEDMIGAWEARPAASAAPAEAKLATPIVVDGIPFDRVRIEDGPSEQKDPPGRMTLVPLGHMVQVSGLSRSALSLVSETLGQYGLQVMEGPSGGAVEKLSPPFVPGAAIGAQLMRGDFQMAGLGTVTMIEGKKVLAFGHPFMQVGSIDLPMTGGYVYDIMPSMLISFKQMSATRVVGQVNGDYQSAIAGVIGGSAKMLPVSIQVKDGAGAPRTYSVEVARTRELMPVLVASAAMTAVDEARTRSTRGTARVTLRFDFADRPSIVRKEIGYSSSDPANVVVPLVLSPLSAFLGNPFRELRPTRVSIQVETEDLQRTATIERVTVGQSRFKAGDDVTLSVMLRPYAKAPVEVPVTFPLPADLPRGSVRIVVTGGREADAVRAGVGAPRPAPTTLEQLLDRYATQDSGFALVTQGVLTRGGAALLGVELPDLPRAAAEALQASRPSDLRPLPTVAKVVKPTEWALSGRAMVTIQVESPIAPGARISGSGGAPSGEPSGGEEEESGEGGAEDEFFPLSPESVAMAATPAKPGEASKPEAKSGPTKAAEQTAQADKGKPQKPLTSAPALWVQRTRGDYVQAKLHGVAVADDGALSLVPGKSAIEAAIPADVIWCVAARGGTAYVGTGTGGLIYRVSEKGEVSAFFDTHQMNVHALAFDAEGNLYAGTSPDGKLFGIGPDGRGKMVYDSDSTYLWSLVVGPDGTVYAAGGSPGRVYAITPAGQGRVFAEVGATNVLSLALTKEGMLYAGTANAGLLYRITPQGTASVAARATGAAIDALALADDGTLYFSSTPGGDIQRIRPGGLPETYAQAEQPLVYGLAALPGGDLVAATGPAGLVMRITGENHSQLIHHPEAGTATALSLSGNDLYLASTAPSALRHLNLEAAGSGTLESAVLDAGRTAHWGKIATVADLPSGTEVQVETRSGNTPDPEEQWSVWSAPNDGAIQSPPARYLQYRLTLSSQEAEASPVVREVRISRQPENQPPMVALKAPAAGTAISKKVQVKWQGRDPDKDALSYDLELSRDVGRTWKELKAGLSEPKYDWDTTKTEDGQYLLRLTASDKRSQPWSPESAADSEVVVVDNTAPALTLFSASVTISSDRRATVTGLVSDKLTPITSVEYRVDDGEWQSIPFHLRDSLTTDFSITTDPLSAGERKIEVHAFDAAGNVATDKVTPKVHDGAAAPAKAEEKPPGAEPAAAAETGEETEAEPAADEGPAADEEPAADEAPTGDEEPDQGE